LFLFTPHRDHFPKLFRTGRTQQADLHIPDRTTSKTPSSNVSPAAATRTDEHTTAKMPSPDLTVTADTDHPAAINIALGWA
jgi:hypothetical protein